MVPFDVFLLVCYNNHVLTTHRCLRYSTCYRPTMTLRPGLRVTQGHRNRHVSIRQLWLPVNVAQLPWAYLVPFPSSTVISVKYRKIFPTSVYFAPRRHGSLWNWVSAHGIKMLEWWGY